MIDGYVWLDSQNRKGLGAYLFDELGQSVPVIGVAKTRFAGSGAVEVFRGKSSRPLLVTAAGIEVSQAAQNIQAMAGSSRIPVLLKRADYLSRHG